MELWCWTVGAAYGVSSLPCVDDTGSPLSLPFSQCWVLPAAWRTRGNYNITRSFLPKLIFPAAPHMWQADILQAQAQSPTGARPTTSGSHRSREQKKSAAIHTCCNYYFSVYRALIPSLIYPAAPHMWRADIVQPQPQNPTSARPPAILTDSRAATIFSCEARFFQRPQGRENGPMDDVTCLKVTLPKGLEGAIFT